MNYPLHDAVLREQPLVVSDLLNQGFDVNLKDYNDETALHEAIQKLGSLEISKQLIDFGADVNAKDRYGFSTIYSAIYKPNAGIIKLLIDAGADVNERNPNSSTPLHLTILNLVRLLDTDPKAKEWTAEYSEYTNIFKLLLEAKANVTA